ncbi:FCH domain-containing protein [Entamoeba marina]
MDSLIYEFPAVSNYLEAFSSLTIGCINFFNEKASIEKEYGSRLLNLCKSPLRKNFQRNQPKDLMSSTCKNCVDDFINQNKILAEAHLNAAKFISNNIVLPIKNASQQLEKQCEFVISKVNRKVKQHSDMIATVNRLYSDKEQQQCELKKVRLEMKKKTGRQLQKATVRQDKIIEQLKKSTTDIKNCSNIANKMRLNVYGNDMKEALKELSIFSEKWNHLITRLFELGNDLDVELVKTNHKYCLKIEKDLKHMNWQQDLNEFVKKWNGCHFINELTVSDEDLLIDKEEQRYSPTSLLTMSGDECECLKTKQCVNNGSTKHSS